MYFLQFEITLLPANILLSSLFLSSTILQVFSSTFVPVLCAIFPILPISCYCINPHISPTVSLIMARLTRRLSGPLLPTLQSTKSAIIQMVSVPLQNGRVNLPISDAPKRNDYTLPQVQCFQSHNFFIRFVFAKM